MLADPLQYVDQMGEGIDAVQTAGNEQARHDAHAPGAEFHSANIPGFALHRYGSQGALSALIARRTIKPDR